MTHHPPLWFVLLFAGCTGAVAGGLAVICWQALQRRSR